MFQKVPILSTDKRKTALIMLTDKDDQPICFRGAQFFIAEGLDRLWRQGQPFGRL